MLNSIKAWRRSFILWQNRNHRLVLAIQIILLLFVLAALLFSRGARLNYRWQWYRMREFFFYYEEGSLRAGLLLQGLLVTLQISAVSLISTLLVGFVTAMLRLSESTVGRFIAVVYTELIRNTPLLVQIYLLYFVIAPVFGLSRFVSAVLALTLFEGAYTAEIIRAGISAVPKGQWEAAASLGLSGWQQRRHIILPLAFRNILPILAGQGVTLFKDSSLVSVIAVYDITMRSRQIIAQTLMPFEVWFSAAAIYLLFTVTLSLLIRRLEKRWELKFYA